MFFKKKKLLYSYGDHRSTRHFSLLPRYLVDETRLDVGIVWLGYYDRVEKFYTATTGWSKSYNAMPGLGPQIASDLARMYGGRFIE